LIERPASPAIAFTNSFFVIVKDLKVRPKVLIECKYILFYMMCKLFFLFCANSGTFSTKINLSYMRSGKLSKLMQKLIKWGFPKNHVNNCSHPVNKLIKNLKFRYFVYFIKKIQKIKKIVSLRRR